MAAHVVLDLTAAAHEPIVASEPEEAVVADEHAPAAPLPAGAAGRGLSPARGGAAVLQPGSAEPDAPLLGGFGAAALPAGGAEPDAPRLGGAGDAADLDAALLAVASPLGAMPAGVHVGTFVHRLLQVADFAAPDLDAELLGHIAGRGAPRGRRRPGARRGRRSVRRCARRSGRCSAGGGCATSRAPTASTSSASSCRSPAARRRAADGLDLGAVGALLREHLPPATRSPATRTG